MKFVLAALFISAGTLDASPSAQDSTHDDTRSKKKRGVIFIPAIFYTPETKTAAGASAMFYYRSSGRGVESRPSTVSPTFIYTQRKQVISLVALDLYFKDELYRLNGGITYMKYPDKFYGIGPSTPEAWEEDYTPRSVLFRFAMQRRIRNALSLGVQYQFAKTKLLEVEQNGLLAGKDILGSAGGAVSGAGVLANWDTRDKIFYPRSGSYCQVSATVFEGVLGSDYDFQQVNLDLRKYFPWRASDALALQSYMNFLSGDSPFQMLSKIGGSSLMRGYYDGRYRDRHVVAFQAEYRVLIWWRLGAAAFAGVGDVANRIDDFDIDRLKFSLGGGVRYLFSRDVGINVRLDVGYGKDSSGFYVTLGEAF